MSTIRVPIGAVSLHPNFPTWVRSSISSTNWFCVILYHFIMSHAEVKAQLPPYLLSGEALSFDVLWLSWHLEGFDMIWLMKKIEKWKGVVWCGDPQDAEGFARWLKQHLESWDHTLPTEVEISIVIRLLGGYPRPIHAVWRSIMPNSGVRCIIDANSEVLVVQFASVCVKAMRVPLCEKLGVQRFQFALLQDKKMSVIQGFGWSLILTQYSGPTNQINRLNLSSRWCWFPNFSTTSVRTDRWDTSCVLKRKCREWGLS